MGRNKLWSNTPDLPYGCVGCIPRDDQIIRFFRSTWVAVSTTHLCGDYCFYRISCLGAILLVSTFLTSSCSIPFLPLTDVWVAATSRGSIPNRLTEECLAAVLTGLDRAEAPRLHSCPSGLFTIGRVGVGNDSQRGYCAGEVRLQTRFTSQIFTQAFRQVGTLSDWSPHDTLSSDTGINLSPSAFVFGEHEPRSDPTQRTPPAGCTSSRTLRFLVIL